MPHVISSRSSRLARGAARYGPTFVLEVALFWLLVKAVEATGYGHPSASFAPSWYPIVSIVIVAAAMGAGEARFHLFHRRRLWSKSEARWMGC